MRPGILSYFTWTTLVAVLGSANGPAVMAQANAPPGQPRTTNERVVTQTPTPPPVDTEARRAAEGQLAPGGRTAGGAIDPARGIGTARPASGAAMDPAMRLEGAARAGASTTYPSGMEAAMLIEHALGMAIEGSALKAIAGQTAAGAADQDPAKTLREHANRQMVESQRLLGQAAADGRGLAANPTTFRFLRAADLYVSTLTALDAANAGNKAQVAMINHSVKEALDANHIRQMARSANGSLAMEHLVRHAGEMRNEGTQSILRMVGNGPVDPNAAPAIATLAQRGRDVIDAAEQLGNAPANPAALGAPAGTVNPAGIPPVGPNPGRLQDDRARIIGGTDGTGSQGTGTVKTAETPARPAPNTSSREGSPIPKTPDASTGSTGGTRPR